MTKILFLLVPVFLATTLFAAPPSNQPQIGVTPTRPGTTVITTNSNLLKSKLPPAKLPAVGITPLQTIVRDCSKAEPTRVSSFLSKTLVRIDENKRVIFRVDSPYEFAFDDDPWAPRYFVAPSGETTFRDTLADIAVRDFDAIEGVSGSYFIGKDPDRSCPATATFKYQIGGFAFPPVKLVRLTLESGDHSFCRYSFSISRDELGSAFAALERGFRSNWILGQLCAEDGPTSWSQKFQLFINVPSDPTAGFSGLGPTIDRTFLYGDSSVPGLEAEIGPIYPTTNTSEFLVR